MVVPYAIWIFLILGGDRILFLYGFVSNLCKNHDNIHILLCASNDNVIVVEAQILLDFI